MNYGIPKKEVLGVISDAHGNGPAFDLGLQELKRAGAERFIFLGDALGYIPSKSVIVSLRKLGNAVTCIKGNHEFMLLGKDASNAERDVYRHELIRQLLSKSDLAFIAGWKESHTETVVGKELLFVHGSPDDPTEGRVYPYSDLSKIVTSADLIFMGNTHRPFVREYGGKTFVNVGSCGLPRDDGRYGSAVCVIVPSLEIRVLRYRVDETTKAYLDSYDVDPNVVQSLGRRADLLVGDVV